MEVRKDKNSVTFLIDSFRGDIPVTLDKRYFIYEVNRHDYALFCMERYFLNEGPRGCMTNASLLKEFTPYCLAKKRGFKPKKIEFKHYSNFEDIWVVDLKMIFPDVDFEENDVVSDVKALMSEPYIRYYDEI